MLLDCCRERGQAAELVAAAAKQAMCPACDLTCQQASQAAAAALRSQLQVALASVPISKAGGQAVHPGKLQHPAVTSFALLEAHRELFCSTCRWPENRPTPKTMCRVETGRGIQAIVHYTEDG